MKLTFVVCRPDASQEKEYEVSGRRIVIGRSADCTIELSDDIVSGEHAVVEQRGSEFRVSDLNSTNGLFHNTTKTSSAPLKPGDYLQFGENGPKIRVSQLHTDATLAPKSRAIGFSAGIGLLCICGLAAFLFWPNATTPQTNGTREILANSGPATNNPPGIESETPPRPATGHVETASSLAVWINIHPNSKLTNFDYPFCTGWKLSTDSIVVSTRNAAAIQSELEAKRSEVGAVSGDNYQPVQQVKLSPFTSAPGISVLKVEATPMEVSETSDAEVIDYLRNRDENEFFACAFQFETATPINRVEQPVLSSTRIELGKANSVGSDQSPYYAVDTHGQQDSNFFDGCPVFVGPNLVGTLFSEDGHMVFVGLDHFKVSSP